MCPVNKNRQLFLFKCIHGFHALKNEYFMKPFRYYMRSLHRDLGYFVVGLVVIYSLSGIILIYRDTGFMKHDVLIEKKLEPALSGLQLNDALRLKGFSVKTETDRQILFNTGCYDKQTGQVSYTVQEVDFPFNRFISLHKVVSSKSVHWLMVIFGVILFFLAVSSFWMFKPGSRFFRRGIWLAIIGAAGTIILMLFV